MSNKLTLRIALTYCGLLSIACFIMFFVIMIKMPFTDDGNTNSMVVLIIAGAFLAFVFVIIATTSTIQSDTVYVVIETSSTPFSEIEVSIKDTCFSDIQHAEDECARLSLLMNDAGEGPSMEYTYHVQQLIIAKYD